MSHLRPPSYLTVLQFFDILVALMQEDSRRGIPEGEKEPVRIQVDPPSPNTPLNTSRIAPSPLPGTSGTAPTPPWPGSAGST